MGVPKFFRWLSERYPLTVQRYGSPVSKETYQLHYGDEKEGPRYVLAPDPLSVCGLPPQIDRLYIDMNGLIHGCSHNNEEREDEKENNNTSADVTTQPRDPSFKEERTEADIFASLCYYLDRIVRDVAQPKELLFLAIDGVAPRAKLNQQRARRYRAGKEGEIERTIYDAHLEQEIELQLQEEAAYVLNGEQSFELEEDLNTEYGKFRNAQKIKEHRPSSSTDASLTTELKEVEPGRFAGKFEMRDEDSTSIDPLRDGPGFQSLHDADGDDDGGPIDFSSNLITPGTAFFQRCTDHLEHFIKYKISTDPAWQKLTVIFSGCNTPGEGEHKIMQFIREQQSLKRYQPNLRHCIMGQDGDLIMLGLASHEPNLFLLRERIIFSSKRKCAQEKDFDEYGLEVYLQNTHFDLLHMNVLRDYLAFEFGTSNVLPESPYDLESTIDDFVFLTFLIGNDFLPSLPALDIADNAFDLLFHTYRDLRRNWMIENKTKRNSLPPYLTHSGEIVSADRLEEFFQELGSYESGYYNYKESTKDLEAERRIEAKFGRQTIPDDEILESKEKRDRFQYRKLVEMGAKSSIISPGDSDDDFVPAMSSSIIFPPSLQPQDTDGDPVAGRKEQGWMDRMGKILHFSVQGNPSQKLSNGESASIANLAASAGFDDKDFKGRYYADKFGFSPFDKEKHLALRKAYIEGLVWTLKYYYHKTVSWEWFYPYHYAPMISDLTGLEKMMKEIKFGNPGAPLLPFQQLLACMPASHSNILPKPFRPLMTDDNSPLKEYYPSSFTVDMNGKRWPWEAVVLLPFIDADKLRAASKQIDHDLLTEDERARNVVKENLVFFRDETKLPRKLEALPASESQKFDLRMFGELAECTTVAQVVSQSAWKYDPHLAKKEPRFMPMLHPQVLHPLDGLPTLRDGSISSVSRRSLKINVHGSSSKYETAVLELRSDLPEILGLEILAQQLIGTTIYINYPHLTEALVTAVSDSQRIIRGEETAPKFWNPNESKERKELIEDIVHSYGKGVGLTGTGGMLVPGFVSGGKTAIEVLLSVRPLKGISTLKDGTVGKTFYKFETMVPLFVTTWKPSSEDARLKGLPLLVEKDRFQVAAGRIFSPRGRLQRWSVLSSSVAGDAPADSVMRRTTVAAQALSSRGFATWTARPSVDAALRAPATLDTIVGWPRYQNRHTALAPRRAVARAPRTAKLFATGFIAAAWFLSGAAGASISSFDYPYRKEVEPAVCGGFGQEAATTLLSNHACVTSSIKSNNIGPLQWSPTPPLNFAHGTTTLAFVYQGGIVVAVDSRASLGTFIGSKTTQKVLPISSKILGTMAGGAADCSFWIRKLASQAALHEVVHNGKRMSVARASRHLSQVLYQYRELGLSVGTMIMGYNSDSEDEEDAEPHLYYVDDRGTWIKGDMFSVGSGSTFALSVLDGRDLFSLSFAEAIELAVQAIRHATFRDGSSGGYINVYHIGPKDKEWKRVFRQDVAAILVDNQRETPGTSLASLD